MKTFILTIDYELFLGTRTGAVRECMIEPTDRLSDILEKNNSKMTIFWDILHYYRLLQLEVKYSKLGEDRKLIENQIISLVEKGHDVQMHLHPHWINAKYENEKWVFTYDRFRLHNLSKKNNINDVNTIFGCVSISKKLMENTIRKVRPSYNVTSFRAGGYLIEPFCEISEALRFNKIFIDSSVVPEKSNNNGVFSYNFKDYPSKSLYRFEESLSKVNENGRFIEIPITTIKINFLMNILFILIRRIKYSKLELHRGGTGSGAVNMTNKNHIWNKLIYIFFKKRINQLTTDSNFKEKFNYLINMATSGSNLILHPKLLNHHTLELMKDYLLKSKLKFVSIAEYLKTHD